MAVVFEKKMVRGYLILACECELSADGVQNGIKKYLSHHNQFYGIYIALIQAVYISVHVIEEPNIYRKFW